MVACAKGVTRAPVDVTHEAAVRLAAIDGVTVELEDSGQDFLEFDIVGGRIVRTRPRLGDVWNGMRVLNRTLAAGDYIWLRMPQGARPLRHFVAAIRPLDRVRIGATDV